MPGPRILCIDRSNDGRGPFAQAYLELLRVLQANSSESRKWLFKDVSSAGLNVSSEFSRSHSNLFPKDALFWPKQEARGNLALIAFDKNGTFDSSEKRTIMARVANRKIRGLRGEDFRKFDHVICFEEQTYGLLKVLKQAASNDAHGVAMPAKVHLLKIGWDLHKSAQEMQTAKSVLRQWAGPNLGWKDPHTDVKAGLWRTKQVIIQEAGFTALLRNKEKRLERIKADTGCHFHFSAERDDGMRVVSIVGDQDKGRLDAAAVKVLYTVSFISTQPPFVRQLGALEHQSCLFKPCRKEYLRQLTAPGSLILLRV